MAQKHLQLLRNSTIFGSYAAAYAALTAMTSYADGTPILARYSGETGQSTLLGVVNNGSVDIINNVADYLLHNYTAFTGSDTSISAADDVKTAIAKLEKHIQDVESDVTVSVEASGDTMTQAHLEVASALTDSGDTFTLKLKDVASATALTQEISDRESGDTALSNRLGTGVTSANTATAQLTALSGNGSSTSAETSVEGAKRYTDEKISELSGIVDSLDANSVSGDSKVVIDVTQENGQITATAANLTGVKLDGLTAGTDTDIAATDTLGQALGKLQAQINAMDKTADAVAGQVVTTVAEADGKVTETKANVKDLQLGGYVKDTTATGAISGTDTVNAALSKLENQIGQNAIGNEDGSINVSATTNGTDINVNIKSGEKVLAKDGNDGLYTDLDFVKITTGLPETVKERYQFLATDDSQIGANLDIPKDSHIVSINYITTGEHAQNLEYVYIDVSGNTQTTYVDMSELVLESEFASGVTVTDHVAHGVVDPTSETFLTVGTDGFKLAGVQDAIDTAISGLDFTTDAAVAGQYVAAIQEADGIVSVKTRANVSEAVLNNYAKGSDATAVAATDTVNQAISKLENQVDAAKAAATTKVVEGTDAGNNMEIVPTTGADESVTYTINLTDIASASALTNEISYRKAVDGVNGNAYTADTNGHYISSATTLYSADQVLDTAIYNEVTARTAAIEALDYADTAVTGQYVSEVDEENGVISVSRLNVSDAPLNGYVKGSDGSAVDSGDTINEAISKLENQIDDVEGDYLKNVVVNNVTGTVADNVATVVISGSNINLGTGYTGSETGAPTTADTVNAAIGKLYNKTNSYTSSANTIDITTGDSSTNFDVILDETTNASTSATNARYASDNYNAIENTGDGLYVSAIWDCGTYN